MNGNSGTYSAAAVGTSQPPSLGAEDYRRMLRQIALYRRENSPTETPSPRNVSSFRLSRSDQTLEDAFSRLNVDSDDYLHHYHHHHHHHHQPSYWSFDAEFQSPTSQNGGNGWAVWSDTNSFERLTSDPYLLNGINEQSLVINSSPLMTPTYTNSNESSSNFFGNDTVRRNLENNERHQRAQETLNFVPVERLRGKIAYLAKDQNGCRILQNTMEGLTNAREIEMIFVELIGHVCDLMLDPFGNYVVQKLVELCNEEQRTQIIAMLTRTNFQLVSICLDMHGTRVVQKLLEHVTSKLQVALFMQAMSPYAIPLCKSANGQHVIQYCLRNFSDEDNAHLLNEVADNCIEVATDKSGCCVLQQCVENSHGHVRDRLGDEIIANAIFLSEDRYGNYVVQYILGMKSPEMTTRLFIQLRSSFMSLSLGKYGSNVVEKCLRECDEFQASKIIKELLRNPNAPMLLTDPYGNYVIQSSLSVSKGEVRRELLNLVDRYAQTMRSNLYGKKILAWLERRNIQLRSDMYV